MADGVVTDERRARFVALTRDVFARKFALPPRVVGCSSILLLGSSHHDY